MRAQNPVIRNQFSADPTARVFGDSLYLYPSHDILAVEGKGRVGWFCMEDYHVFSSAGLSEWVDHGAILSQNNIPWVKKDSYSMWAPDCVERNGKFYFYFPTTPADTAKYGKGFRIGVAIAATPTGPFVPQPQPISEVRGIDPNVFIDQDGQAYLYWAAGNIYGARLRNDMLSIEPGITTLAQLPATGLKEGPFVFARKGRYYLTYPHVQNKIERLEYAMSENPLGPFTYAGVIMDESPTGCWTNHQSIVQYQGQWYLFYHHNDYSPGFDKARSVRIDSLSFNEDGTIRKVIPSLRGAGITKATDTIQIDRYSNKAVSGVSISFIDTADVFKGWKTAFSAPDAWISYNSVEFSSAAPGAVSIKFMSAGGKLDIHTGAVDGPLLASVNLPAAKDWQVARFTLTKQVGGVQHLYIVSKTAGEIMVDWISFH